MCDFFTKILIVLCLWRVGSCAGVPRGAAPDGARLRDAIALMLQGVLYKKSNKPLSKDWKKKYVSLMEGRLSYHPNIQV